MRPVPALPGRLGPEARADKVRGRGHDFFKFPTEFEKRPLRVLLSFLAHDPQTLKSFYFVFPF